MLLLVLGVAATTSPAMSPTVMVTPTAYRLIRSHANSTLHEAVLPNGTGYAMGAVHCAERGPGSLRHRAIA